MRKYFSFVSCLVIFCILLRAGGLSSNNVDYSYPGGLYVEVGYLAQKIDRNFPLSGVIVQTGWRFYL
jgi:hypothetical protein